MTVPFASEVQQPERVHSGAYVRDSDIPMADHRASRFAGGGLVGPDEVSDVCPVCNRRLPHLFAPCSSWQRD